MSDKTKKVDGFSFLLQKRGKAVKHLLSFMGESATHLDDKTKFLLYVMMMTINWSPRGLTQYIPKALAAGASEEEIIDTVLVSYPACGLAKVVDALDLLNGLPAILEARSAHAATEKSA